MKILADSNKQVVELLTSSDFDIAPVVAPNGNVFVLQVQEYDEDPILCRVSDKDGEGLKFLGANIDGFLNEYENSNYQAFKTSDGKEISFWEDSYECEPNSELPSLLTQNDYLFTKIYACSLANTHIAFYTQRKHALNLPVRDDLIFGYLYIKRSELCLGFKNEEQFFDCCDSFASELTNYYMGIPLGYYIERYDNLEDFKNNRVAESKFVDYDNDLEDSLKEMLQSA